MMTTTYRPMTNWTDACTARLSGPPKLDVDLLFFRDVADLIGLGHSRKRAIETAYRIHRGGRRRKLFEETYAGFFEDEAKREAEETSPRTKEKSTSPWAEDHKT
jgi:hypothetical protein